MQFHVDIKQTKCDVLHTVKTFVYSFQYSSLPADYVKKKFLEHCSKNMMLHKIYLKNISIKGLTATVEKCNPVTVYYV